jgi:hypothetical protein
MTAFMIKKPTKSLADVPSDIAVDYALIATGVAAGLIGLIYLMMI